MEAALSLAQVSVQGLVAHKNKKVVMNKNPSIKLNEKTVYDISSVNQDENPNNAVLVAFYACRADDSISMMNLDVIQRLLKEEFFG